MRVTDFQRRRRDGETGLIYFRARMYDPARGHWTQREPLSLAPGANMHEFCSSDPIAHRDPLGLEEHVDDWSSPVYAQYGASMFPFPQEFWDEFFGWGEFLGTGRGGNESVAVPNDGETGGNNGNNGNGPGPDDGANGAGNDEGGQANQNAAKAPKGDPANDPSNADWSQFNIDDCRAAIQCYLEKNDRYMAHVVGWYMCASFSGNFDQGPMTMNEACTACDAYDAQKQRDMEERDARKEDEQRAQEGR